MYAKCTGLYVVLEATEFVRPIVWAEIVREKMGYTCIWRLYCTVNFVICTVIKNLLEKIDFSQLFPHVSPTKSRISRCQHCHVRIVYASSQWYWSFWITWLVGNMACSAWRLKSGNSCSKTLWIPGKRSPQMAINVMMRWMTIPRLSRHPLTQMSAPENGVYGGFVRVLGGVLNFLMHLFSDRSVHLLAL